MQRGVSHPGLVVAPLVAILVAAGLGVVVVSLQVAGSSPAAAHCHDQNGGFIGGDGGSIGGGVEICPTQTASPTGTAAPSAPVNGGVGTGQAKCPDAPNEKCESDMGGIWFTEKGCYAHPMEDQPSADSDLWNGHDPTKGSIWECAGDPENHYIVPPFFVPNGSTPALIDPATLAEGAVKEMPLVTADASMAPAAGNPTFLNVDNWLWLPDGQWETVSLRVSAGGTTVTVTAEPVRVTWDVGPEKVTCPDAGREWKDHYRNESTTCSYAYTELENPRGDTHDVSAQITYAVLWTCSGACLTGSGELGEVTPPAGASTPVEVYQRQTVVKKR